MARYVRLSDEEAGFWRGVREQFLLADDEIYLNSGALSSIPRRTYLALCESLKRSERNPTIELHRNWGRQDASRERIARYMGARAEDVVFFSNVTMSVNALLRGLPLEGGELVYSDQEYMSLRRAAHFIAERRGMSIRKFPMPITPAEPGEVTDSVIGALGEETRLVYMSHIVYGTGMMAPIARIAAKLAERGVLLAVDGAHAPGQIRLRLGEMPGVSAYGGNLHKWFLGPKGTGFAWVPEALHERVNPLMIGFGGYIPWRGAASTEEPLPPFVFHKAFKMPGCIDYSPMIALAATLDFREEIGEQRILARLGQLAAYTRETFQRELGWTLLTPTHPELSSAISSFRLPEGFPLTAGGVVEAIGAFYRKHGIVVSFGGPGERCIRVSPHIYNSEAEIDRLVECLKTELKSG